MSVEWSASRCHLTQERPHARFGPLHDHLRRRSRRRQPRPVPRVPRPRVARRVRRLAGPLQEPVPRPPGRRPQPQLGHRASQRRPRRRRRRRRGALPQHRAAVLPHRRRHRPCALARGVPQATRRPAGPQPVAGRLRRRVARASRRAGPDRPQRRRRGRGRRALGPRAGPAGHPAARRLAGHPLDRAALLGRLRPVVGRVPGARHVDHPPRRWQRHPRLRQPPVDHHHLRPRDRLLRQPGPLAPRPCRACSSASRASSSS